MRVLHALLAGTAFAVTIGVASPALAATSSNTTTTFAVTAGTLDIAAAANANVGSAAAGAAIDGSLGSITVTDGRAGANAAWTATVTTTDFTTGGATAPETVGAALVQYWSGAATGTTGNGTFTAGQANLAARAALDNSTPLTAYSHTGGTGNNTAAWSPSLRVNTPLANLAGTYSGTVTHSVA